MPRSSFKSNTEPRRLIEKSLVRKRLVLNDKSLDQNAARCGHGNTGAPPWHICQRKRKLCVNASILHECFWQNKHKTETQLNSHDKDGIPANAFSNFEARNPLRRATLFIAELCQAVTVQKCRCQSLDGQCCKQISTVVPFFRTNTVFTDHWIPTCFYCRLLSIKIHHASRTHIAGGL